MTEESPIPPQASTPPTPAGAPAKSVHDSPTSPPEPAPKAEPTHPGATPTSEDPPRADWETRFKYLLADFENFRRRGDREKEAVRLRAEAELLKALLPIYEAFERALESAGRGPSSDPHRRGMELLAGEWEQFLKRAGVTPVAAAGAPFDADEHEAVSEAPVRPGRASGTILEVIQQGYRFRGGLLRPAKVVVARARLAETEVPEKAGDVSGSGSTS